MRKWRADNPDRARETSRRNQNVRYQKMSVKDRGKIKKNAKEWVEKKYDKVILGSLRSLDETIKKVEFIIYSQNKPLTSANLSEKMSSDNEVQLSFTEFKFLNFSSIILAPLKSYTAALSIAIDGLLIVTY